MEFLQALAAGGDIATMCLVAFMVDQRRRLITLEEWRRTFPAR
jgi:hypothetical protein